MGNPIDLRQLAERAKNPAPPLPEVSREATVKVTYQGQVAMVRVSAPTGEQRTQVDRMTALLAAGPWDHLTPLARARFHSLATITVLVEAPEWMAARAQEDDDLLFALAGAVETHATRYFRGSRVEDGEAEDGGGVVVAFEN